MKVAVVVPNRDGMRSRWLPGLVASVRAQTRPPDLFVVVDDGSVDESVAWLRAAGPDVEVVARPEPGGFAAAVNAGLARVRESGCDAVALLNTDVVVEAGWLARMERALAADPGCGSVACKMVSMDDPAVIDDAGDALRRDGVCEQRGRGRRDEGAGRWDAPGEVWGACAGAALYRVGALRDAGGGFDEMYGMYLEDVDLALRLRLAGWTCRYEPAVARHAGAGSGAPVGRWVARNTMVLVARWFPWRWAPMVAYRQVSWLVAARRRGVLAEHVRGLADGLRAVPAALRARRAAGGVPYAAIAAAVPARPWRGPRAGGHPEALE